MKTVKVNKAELMQKVLENMDSHEIEYKGALASRRESARKLFANEIHKIDSDPTYQPKSKFYEDLPLPKSQIEDYDRAIGMLGMSVDEVVELDSQSFAELVCDEWDWKRDFTNTLSSYIN